jgi:hypothetical protein
VTGFLWGPARDRCYAIVEVTTFKKIEALFSVWLVRELHKNSYRYNGKFSFQFLSDSDTVQLSSRVTEEEMARGLHSVLKCLFLC